MILSDARLIETWVLQVSIAVPVVCLAALLLWHLVGQLSRKAVKNRQPVRESPEPSQPWIANDPEQLERACAGLVESLAEKYLQLAETWSRKGEPQRAAAALQQLVQRCPETPQAREAADRLRQLGGAIKQGP
jgi:hypothetical protein